MFRRFLYVLMLIGWFTTACAPIAQPGQPNLLQNQNVQLNSQITIGQTLVARNAGLTGISIYLSPITPITGELVIRVWSNADREGVILSSGTLPLTRVTQPGYYSVFFLALPESRNQYYYLEFSLAGSGQLELGANSADTYLDGALYQNNKPQDAQLTFNLIYEPKEFSLGLLNEFSFWTLILFVSVALLILPGFALTLVFGGDLKIVRNHWTEKLAFSLAFSFASYPILMLAFYLIGLQLGIWYAWGMIVISLAIVVWHFRKLRLYQVCESLDIWRKSRVFVPDLVAIVLFCALIGQRFWMIRGLDFPLWNDSYHHTLIVQLLFDSAGLFSSWVPYAPFESFTYHFGFHANAVNLMWVLNLPAAQAVLWMGQLTNIASIITLIPLARWINPNSWSAVLIILIAGLFSAMPNAYVNWGRYTQLTGQVILPVSFVLFADLLSKPQPVFRPQVILCIIVFGGLALTHFRVLIFALPFCIVWIFLARPRQQWHIPFGRLLFVGLGSFLIFLPWLLNTLNGNLTRDVLSNLTTPESLERLRSLAIYNSLFDWREFMPVLVWLLGLLAIILNLWRRSLETLGLALWWGSLFLIANPNWFGLPGQGTVNNFAIQIFSYAPVAVIIASTGYLLEKAFNARNIQILGIIGILVAGSWGLYQRWSELKLFERQLVTRPDLRAIDWLSTNTSLSAVFLINGRFELIDQYVIGTDGAWVTPLLSKRQTTIPSMAYTSERLNPPFSISNINETAQVVLNNDIHQPGFWESLPLQGITHIFIGQRQGKVLNNTKTLLPQELMEVNTLKLVYRADQVWIFEIVR